MRHAGPDALARLDDLLDQLRALPALREPRPGCFYVRGKALVHFHEDGTDLYADVRLPGEHDFRRLRVTTKAERQGLYRDVARV
jgi:hypothetical protein